MRHAIYAAGVMAALAGCSDRSGQTSGASAAPPRPVEAVRVGDAGGPATYRAAGSVRAGRRADLATRMMARIEAVRVRTGDRVRAGQVLVTLERGAVDAAGSQAAAALTLATVHLRRMERLYADSAVPLAQVEAARAAFEQAQGQRNAASAELGYAALVAPFDGVVTVRSADPGDLAAPGQPVLVVESAGEREIVVAVPEAVAAALVPGRTVTVRVGAAEKPVEARITAVVPSADPVSRTVEVRLTAPASLVSNVAAVAELPVSAGRTSGLKVPSGAVLERGGLTGVFLFAADSTARLRWVRLGRSAGSGAEVLSGLVPGDLVVARADQVKDGDRVRPVLEPERAP